MRVLRVTNELGRALDDYRRWGGAVSHVPLEAPSRLRGERHGAERHHAAAVATLASLEAAQNAFLVRNHHPPRSFNTRPEAARGQRITVQAFLGPYYHAARESLMVAVGGDRYELAAPPMLEARDGLDRDGYAYAFANPPYGLRPPGGVPEANVAFHRLSVLLFGGFSEDLVITRWSTDWSGYFEDGLEWWGAFLWTVENPSTGQLAGVAASTTD